MDAGKHIAIHYWTSPLGELVLGDFGGQLCLCDWRYRAKRDQVNERIQKALNATFKEDLTPLHGQVIDQLVAYFEQKRKAFDVPLLFAGSNFQKSVWKTLMTIEYGQHMSYAELAQQMHSPLAIRAIASANGANAHAIIVPCHRIIGANGSLVGYAGGLKAKERLLRLEGALPQLDLFS